MRVLDDIRNGSQPRGKQSKKYKSHGCSYTRFTGIWQTVWLESVDMYGIESCNIIPDLDGACFIVIPRYHAVKQGLTCRVTVTDGDDIVATEEGSAV